MCFLKHYNVNEAIESRRLKNEFPLGKVIKSFLEHWEKKKKKLPTVLAISHEGASYFDERADISLPVTPIYSRNDTGRWGTRGTRNEEINARRCKPGKLISQMRERDISRFINRLISPSTMKNVSFVVTDLFVKI